MGHHGPSGGADPCATGQLKGHFKLVVQELEDLRHTLLALKPKHKGKQKHGFAEAAHRTRERRGVVKMIYTIRSE